MVKKLMTWNPKGVNGKTLFVLDANEKWVTYRTGVPIELQRPDEKLKPSFAAQSDGFATMQHLLKLGWKLVDGSKNQEEH